MQLSVTETERDLLARLLIAILAGASGQPKAEAARPAPPPEPRGPSRPNAVAKRRGVSRAYVYAEIKRGKLKAHRPGGDGPFFVEPEDEDTWWDGRD